MNILFLNVSTANPTLGGVQCVSYYLYQYFVSQGHHVVMLAWEKTVEKSSDDFFYMPDKDKILSIRNETFLKTLVKDNGIQIVMNHTCLEPRRAKIVKCLSKYNVKIVNIFHSSPFGMFGINKFNWMQNIRNKNIKRLLDYGIRLAFVLKYRYWLNMQVKYADKTVLLSNRFKSEYCFFAGSKYFDKLLAMPNPLTVEEVKLCEKENVLLFVGRLSHEKGLSYLLDIWHLLEDKYPDWRLDIVGDGEERENVEMKIKQLGLKRCKLYGFQKPEPYYSRSKIFCMTSLFEGFGLVLIEAMHYGTVPLAFDSYANVGDIIDRDKNGMLIPPFDVELYANTLSLLMDSPALLESMSQEAIKKSECYAIENIGNQWIRLFEDLLKWNNSKEKIPTSKG